MKIRTKRVLVGGIISILSATIIFGNSVYADQPASSLNEDVITANELLKEVFVNSYDKAQDDAETMIEKTGSDYELSMETFFKQGNPLQQVDTAGILAAYATMKAHGKGSGIAEINFININAQPQIISEVIPVSIPDYKENSDGTYQKEGEKYLTQDTTVDTYSTADGQSYVKTGEKRVSLKTQNTKYLDFTLTDITPQMLLDQSGLSGSEYIGEFELRKAQIEAGATSTGLAQSTIFNLPEINSENYSEYLSAMSVATEKQKNLLNTAVSLLGKVPYEWGGKSTKAGYDNTWWTFGSDGKQKGLDCSGFIEWVFRTAGYPQDTWSKFHSTGDVLNNFETIPYSQLQIGDVGLLNNGEDVNHIGIYIGNGYFIHCSSSSDTVVINNLPFTVFKHVPQVEEDEIVAVDSQTQAAQTIPYTQDDVKLLAQTIDSEAAGEGLNGWIAVGEVIVNRYNSGLYPRSISDIIYSDGQFENVQRISMENPTDAMLQVAEQVLQGQLRVFNNPDVMYFRNPGDINDNADWGNYKFYERINHHAFYLQLRN